MKALGGKHMGADGFDDRHQACRRRTDPIGQRRDIELDAFAGISFALAIEWQMHAVFAEQHMGKKVRSSPAAGDRMRRRLGLGDRFATATRELLAHVLDHLPARRHELQRLGDVFAELAQ